MANTKRRSRSAAVLYTALGQLPRPATVTSEVPRSRLWPWQKCRGLPDGHTRWGRGFEQMTTKVSSTPKMLTIP